MATKSSRTESEEVRRGQLLDAARIVFREKGYEGATVAEIAIEAGLGKGTFYYYYPTKTAIAVALRDGLMNRIADAVQGATGSTKSFEDNLESLVAVSFRLARQNADLMKLAFVGADDMHQELHSESPEHAAFLTSVTDLFNGAAERDQMRTVDIRITARLVIGLIKLGVIEEFVTVDGNEGKSLEAVVKSLITNALVQPD